MLPVTYFLNMPQIDKTTLFFNIEGTIVAFIVLSIVLFIVHKVAIFAGVKLAFARKSISKFHAYRCVSLFVSLHKDRT
jgi:hypothetical protein